MAGLPGDNVGKETTSEIGEDKKEHIKQTSKEQLLKEFQKEDSQQLLSI